MKQLVLVLLLSIIATAFFTSCETTYGPEKVADKYLTHISNNEFDKAAKYCTDETAQMLSMIASMGEHDDESKLAHENIACTIDGDKAQCTYNYEGSDEVEVIDLIKVDDEWKVYMEK